MPYGDVFSVGESVEAKNMRGWEKGVVTAANDDGTYDVKFANEKKSVGKSWRLSNIRKVAAEPKKVNPLQASLNFINASKALFDEIDKDSSGYASFPELLAACKAGKLSEYGLNGIKDLAKEMKDLDDSGDRVVSYQEFCKYIDDVVAGKEVVDSNKPFLASINAGKQLFDSIDTDGGGHCSFPELMKAVKAGRLEKYGLTGISSLIKNMRGKLDADGSGEVSYTEFQQWLNDVQAGEEVAAQTNPVAAALTAGKKLFDSIDKDASGWCSFPELLKAVKAGDLEKHGLKGMSDLIENMRGELDPDNSGKVGYKEFQLWLNKKVEGEQTATKSIDTAKLQSELNASGVSG